MTKLTLTDLALTSLPLANEPAARFADRLMGEPVPDSEVRGCEGALYSNHGVALVSTGDRDPFFVLIRLGECWRVAGPGMPAYDPFVIAHRDQFTRVSHPEREAEVRRERDRNARRQAEKDEARRLEAERVKEREAEWARSAQIANVTAALRGGGDRQELEHARAAARELGIQPPAGVAPL